MSLSEKIELARQLARLGVDVIEAGFPAASVGDADAVRAVAEIVGRADGPVVCGLARAMDRDITTCAAAIAPAAHGRIHVFLATSDIHLQYKLHITRDEVVTRVQEAVALARTHGADLEL